MIVSQWFVCLMVTTSDYWLVVVTMTKWGMGLQNSGLKELPHHEVALGKLHQECELR